MPTFPKQLKGVTLIETLVAISIMVIAMEGFTFLFIRSWEANRFILEEGMASAAASRATNQIIIQLRGVKQADNGSFPLASADDFDLTIYADVDDDGTTERVHYYVDLATDQLKRGVTEVQPGTPPTYPAGDQVTTVMTNYVVNESDDPAFYYYNDDYPGDTTNNPLATPAAPGSIQLIKIHLFVNIRPLTAPDNINIESFVDLRNLHNYD